LVAVFKLVSFTVETDLFLKKRLSQFNAKYILGWSGSMMQYLKFEKQPLAPAPPQKIQQDF
jgi:hypothetical protein